MEATLKVRYGPATAVRFSVSAQSLEKIEEIAYGHDAELEDGLEDGELGHEGDTPLDEELFNAARWEELESHRLRAAV